MLSGVASEGNPCPSAVRQLTDTAVFRALSQLGKSWATRVEAGVLMCPRAPILGVEELHDDVDSCLADHSEFLRRCEPCRLQDLRMIVAGMNISYLRMSASETERYERTDASTSCIRRRWIYGWELPVSAVARVCWEASDNASEICF